MIKKVLLRTIVTAAAMGASLLATSPASAIGVPGLAGTSNYPSCASTFLVTGQFVNYCSFSVEYYLALPANSGSKSVSVTTNNSGTGTFSCSLNSLHQSGQTFSGTSVFPSGGYQTNTLTITNPANGAMFVSCTIPPNGSFVSANYNQ